MNKNKLIIIYLLTTIHISQSKILIFTYSYNRPDFIEMQDQLFKKFLHEEYSFIVFNDARNQALINEINSTCARLNIQCVKIPQEIHNRPYLPRWPGENYNHPTVRNVNVVQYSLDIIGFNHDDILILVDSDLFLVKPFSIRQFLNGYNLGGMQLSNGYVNYLWHGLAFLDLKTLPNIRTLTFNCGRVEGKPIDAGGHSYYYLKNNPSVKAHFVNHYKLLSLYCDDCKHHNRFSCTHNQTLLEQLKFDDLQIKFAQSVHNVEFYHDNTFIHYIAGSNWNNQTSQYHQQKTVAFNQYINEILVR